MTEKQQDANGSDGGNGSSETGDGTDTKYGNIEGRKAYELYNEKDLSYRQIAEESTVSKDTVRRRIKDFEGGVAQGQESVEPEDFEPQRLKEALEDEEPENEVYETWDCPAGCGAQVQEGASSCPNCDTDLEW